MWTETPTDDYERAQKWYAKKRPNELLGVATNFHQYVMALNAGANPTDLIHRLSFVHNEREGVYAVDQRPLNCPDLRRRKVKLAETRLYFYPEVETHTVFVLTIGDKKEQRRRDVNECHQFVRQRREELKNEIDKQEIQQREGTRSPDSGP